ncbi:MAG: SGNH/GDSL hydrolase family protein [Leadbetterella sp.]|nr:SGNH/GDSL hydrolase family protein [Leadbetterella sp.]
MNRIVIILLVVIVIVLLSGLTLLQMRRQLPFQEVIALDKGIAIINSQKWFVENLEIAYWPDGGNVVKTTFNQNGMKILAGLENGKEYSIAIYRADLKGKLIYKKFRTKVTPVQNGTDYVVLVGASVGKAWNFEQAPSRLGLGADVVFGNRTIYEFDKSRVIEELAQYPFPVAVVIIKECAAYFPRELEASKQKVVEWVNLLREKGKLPMLATVVPVTREHDATHPGRFQSILQYNDFIRDYAARENIFVFDLEKAVRSSDTDRHLDIELAQRDGLHLLQRAYDQRLDNLIVPMLLAVQNE